jgi:prophage regulatory protein
MGREPSRTDRTPQPEPEAAPAGKSEGHAPPERESPRQLIPIRDVIGFTSLSRASIYVRLNKKSRFYDSTFPRPIKLGRRSAWDLGEIQVWIAAQAEASR